VSLGDTFFYYDSDCLFLYLLVYILHESLGVIHESKETTKKHNPLTSINAAASASANPITNISPKNISHVPTHPPPPLPVSNAGAHQSGSGSVHSSKSK
jgi:hypothetical protein